jgi:hypothetical protein
MLEHVDITGAVDMHAHCRPSLYERRVDGYELASLAAAAGMDAVVMKSHYLPTVYGVPYIEQLLDRDGVSDFTVLGSVVLNYCNGGYNPNMVRTALDMGAAVVWHTRCTIGLTGLRAPLGTKTRTAFTHSTVTVSSVRTSGRASR